MLQQRIISLLPICQLQHGAQASSGWGRGRRQADGGQPEPVAADARRSAAAEDGARGAPAGYGGWTVGGRRTEPGPEAERRRGGEGGGSRQQWN